MIEIGRRVEAEAFEQIRIGSGISAAGLDWRDQCDDDQDCYEMGTGWSFVWAWNMAWSIILGLNFIVLAVGAFYWWPRYIGTLCNYVLCNCHLLGVILMFVGV